MPKRAGFRPPGVKPWTKIGPLGPFRGRLGLGWVIAPLVVGAVLVFFGWLFLFRSTPPTGTFVPVGPVSSFPENQARRVDVPGVWVARSGDRFFAVEQEDGCSLTFCRDRFVDCRGVAYGIDGLGSGGGLDVLPVRVYKGVVYVDPDHPLDRTPAPGPSSAASCP